jgi:hypothetical protein
VLDFPYIRIVKRVQIYGLGFIVDKLTNSIEIVTTGEIFNTEVVRLTTNDLNQIHQSEWLFNWRKEIRETTKVVYKLCTSNNPSVIQGLLSIEDKKDHVFTHLIESSKLNKGSAKVYLGVPGNLIAYACKVSVEMGYQGFLAFDAKSALIKHHEEKLHATHFNGLRMFIDNTAAQ